MQRSLSAQVSPGLEVIIVKSLEKRAEDRYQSAKEVLEDLGRVSAPSSVVGTLRRLAARHRALAVNAAVGLVLTSALLLGLSVGGLRDRLRSPSVVTPKIESIAVLPLANLSGDPQQEYFADGMTEELTANLSKIGALKVISRTSAMQYKGAKKPLPQIARELGVDAVIEGSVLRAGNRVRITAQLIQATSDKHLWAESYERDLSDVLALQSEVARAITNEIKIRLTPQEQSRLASARPVNPEAYQALLEARHYAEQGESKKAFAYVQQSIALDPTYAPAYVELSQDYIDETWNGVRPVKEAVPLAKAAVGKALELDPTLAEAHAQLGCIKFWFDWDWSGAEQEFKRTLMLNPNNATAHGAYASSLVQLGRPDEAVREHLKRQELDPLSSSAFGLGVAWYYARRYDESITQLNKAFEANPHLVFPKAMLACVYAQKRMYPEAIATCRGALSMAPEDQMVLGACGNVYALAGQSQDAVALLDRLKKLPPRLHLDPYLVAMVYDGLGNNDRTMEWLERAYRERSPQMSFAKVEFWSDSLRGDPRYQALLRRMNFPP